MSEKERNSTVGTVVLTIAGTILAELVVLMVIGAVLEQRQKAAASDDGLNVKPLDAKVGSTSDDRLIDSDSADAELNRNKLPRATLYTGKMPMPEVYKGPSPIEPFEVFPEFAKARVRDNRVVELTFCQLYHGSPEKRGVKAITVTTRDNGTKEFELIEKKFFLMANELVALYANGRAISTDSLLSSLQTEQVVLVTHRPVAPPAEYLAGLRKDAIVLQIPYLPKITIPAETYGEKATSKSHDGVRAYRADEHYPALDVFPELCKAKSRSHGIVAVTELKLFYSSPDKRDEKAITVAMGKSTKELELWESRYFYLASELRAYRPDGQTLSSEELLQSLAAGQAVLATLAPVRPPKVYLELLAKEAIVLELPYEPRIKISADDLASAKGGKS